MGIDVHASWNVFFECERSKPYFQDLIYFLDDVYSNPETKIFPPKDQVFRLFEMADASDIKVVVIGQDPYPTFGHANGLSFSLNKEVKPLAKSLNNIYKEIANDLNVSAPENGDLSFLVHQGVFLMNTILTVEEGKPLSHKHKGWEVFTLAVLNYVLENSRDALFLLWGSYAEKKFLELDKPNQPHLIASHPSPLSAYKGFFGCKHFSETNNYLKSIGKNEINWTNTSKTD